MLLTGGRDLRLGGTTIIPALGGVNMKTALVSPPPTWDRSSSREGEAKTKVATQRDYKGLEGRKGQKGPAKRKKWHKGREKGEPG